MVKRVVFGAVANPQVAALKDIDAREALVLGVFALFVLALGVWPAPLVALMDGSIASLVQHILASKT
jgi:NADH-quinone oxidoreductase subunit M